MHTHVRGCLHYMQHMSPTFGICRCLNTHYSHDTLKHMTQKHFTNLPCSLNVKLAQ